MKVLQWVAVLIIVSFLPMGLAEENATVVSTETGFLFKTIRVEDREYKYAVYLPREYTKERSWPLILFLHGLGESGTDGAKQMAVGLGPAIMKRPDQWPFVVIFPQKPSPHEQWSQHEAAVMAMVREAEESYNIDPARRYLTGLSQGGNGTMVLGARHARLWAALAPICGYGDPEPIADKLKEMPIWCFHGEADRVVPVDQSKAFVEAVRAAGGSPRLTLYPDVDHNSWDLAYQTEGLAAWLLSHRREPEGKGP